MGLLDLCCVLASALGYQDSVFGLSYKVKFVLLMFAEIINTYSDSAVKLKGGSLQFVYLCVIFVCLCNFG